MFPKVKKLKKVVYLDYAAATPMDPAVKKAMEPFLGVRFGNPFLCTKRGERQRVMLINRAKI